MFFHKQLEGFYGGYAGDKILAILGIKAHVEARA
jgi:hypothetical protein